MVSVRESVFFVFMKMVFVCVCAQAKQFYHEVNASIQKQRLVSTFIVRGEGVRTARKKCLD